MTRQSEIGENVGINLVLIIQTVLLLHVCKK